MQDIEVIVYESVEEAPIYDPPEFKGLGLETVALIKAGHGQTTETVDLILVDSSGQKFVAMTTLNMLREALSKI